MEFGSSVIRRRTTNGGGQGNFTKIRVDAEDEQFNLSMYLQPSAETISIEEFQQLGVQRLAVLRAVELLKEKWANEPKKYLEMFTEKMKQLMPFYANGLLAVEHRKARRDDRISHFILRLAYCQSAEMSDWFVRQETELFKCCFQVESGGVSAFLKANNIMPEEVSALDKRSLRDELSEALTLTPDSVLNNSIYRVKCWDVLDLFPGYRLLIRDGFAYINAADLIALVAPQFRENIAQSLANARRNLGFIQEEDRLIPLMKQIVNNGVGGYKKEYSNSEDIHPQMIDDLARESFPLCMRNIHFNLRKEHHLRHYARQQYGLFLKGIGLSMEGSLEFFRTEFTHRMDGEKFSKEYAYNIRHIYGKEGSRIDRKPLSCATIILGAAPSALDCHGCPYKHWESAMLADRLHSLGLKGDQVTEIQGLCKMNRFDKACTKYFEFVHKIPELEELITHPNQYFTLSRKIREGGGDEPKHPTTTTSTSNKEEENMDEE